MHGQENIKLQFVSHITTRNAAIGTLLVHGYASCYVTANAANCINPVKPNGYDTYRQA